MNSPLNKLWPKKIKTQLILGIALVHLVLMTIFVFDLMRREEKFLRDQNHDQTVNLAKNLAVNIGSYLIADDFYTLERITKSYVDFPYLKYAMVLSPDGKVLAHTDGKKLGTSVSDKIKLLVNNDLEAITLVDDQSVFDVAIPVKRGLEVIGWARIGIGQEYIYSNLNSIIRNGIYYILIALIVGSVLAILMGNLLNRGLYKLITAADEIARGNRNKRTDDLGSYELTKLGGALNHMVDEISSNEKKLNLILESMPIGIFILDSQGQIISHNPAAKKIWEGVAFVGPAEYGMYKARFIDTGFQVKPDEWAVAVALREQREVLNQEVEIECFEGSNKTIINSAILLKDVSDKIVGVLCMNTEITERKHLEREREKMVKDILQRNRDLEQFSYIVSHNIRGPLATLLGLSNMLKGQNTDQEKQTIMRGLGEHAGKLDMVVRDLNQILNVKKDLTQSKVKVSFSDLVNNVKGNLQDVVDKSKATINTNFERVEAVETIKAYLHSVFLNLIANSIKYKMRGVDPVIDIWSEKTENSIKIYFKDNGSGIDLDKYGDQVFGLYKRFHLTTEGKGMGLYMVKTQVAAMNGNIGLESKPERGTLFTVTLPLN